VHFASADVEVDSIERAHPRKLDREAGDLQHGSLGGVH
jgi:hypothetical protein